MSSQTIKTNNDLDLLQVKIDLRIKSIEHLQTVKVLELFGGEGVLWNHVIKQTGKDIKILSIDKNRYTRIQLQGDNIKFIDSININQFDLIDIDSWGSPFPQLDIIFKKKYKGIIHCTFIQTVLGQISKGLLNKIGYSKQMINKCPSLFNKNGMDKFKQYLSLHNVDEINIFSKNRKNYFYFILDK